MSIENKISDLLEWSWYGNASESVRRVAMTMALEEQLDVVSMLPPGKRGRFARICVEANAARERARQRFEEIQRDWAQCLGHSFILAAVATASSARSPFDVMEALS